MNIIKRFLFFIVLFQMNVVFGMKKKGLSLSTMPQHMMSIIKQVKEKPKTKYEKKGDYSGFIRTVKKNGQPCEKKVKKHPYIDIFPDADFIYDFDIDDQQDCNLAHYFCKQADEPLTRRRSWCVRAPYIKKYDKKYQHCIVLIASKKRRRLNDAKDQDMLNSFEKIVGIMQSGWSIAFEKNSKKKHYVKKGVKEFPYQARLFKLIIKKFNLQAKVSTTWDTKTFESSKADSIHIVVEPTSIKEFREKCGLKLRKKNKK